MNEYFSIYLLPPVLSLICGVFLAVVALTRGQITREKLLFALVCLWYSLLAPNFICHHLIKDPDLILTIERRVHFFYVYLPVVIVAFYHHILNIRRNDILLVVFTVSFLISLTTQGDLYFYGLYRYDWGYIAKGGPAFQVYGIFGFAILLYCLGSFPKRLRLETNPRIRLKLKYIFISFTATGILTFLNLPAMLGFNLYPTGNLSFIPLMILAYGILKHRLLDVSTLLRVSMAHFLFLLLVIVPNLFIYRLGLTLLAGVSDSTRFILLLLWFGANYGFVLGLRRLFDRWFFKTRHGLKLAEMGVIRELLELREVDALAVHVDRAIRSCLSFPWAKVYTYDNAQKAMVAADGDRCPVPGPVVRKLSIFQGVIEYDLLDLTPALASVQAPLRQILTRLNSVYAIPLIHKEAFIGLLMLPEKENRLPIHQAEAAFLKSVTVTLAVALTNTIMFQRISALKDHLQVRTEALTKEVGERKRIETDLKAAQRELRETNAEMEMAVLAANEMRVKAELTNQELLKEIDNRHRIEEALRQSEAMYRLLTDNSADVIWTVDLEDNFTYASPSVFQLLGYSPEEIAGIKMADVLTAQSYQLAKKTLIEDLKRIRTASGRHKDRYLELEQVRKDGTTVWTEVNTRFVRDGNGAIHSVVGVTRDITRRRQTEQELHYIAYHDGLTGLYNRKAFIELLENEIKYAQRYQSGLALLFIDLNKFKQVNDTFGHEVGDLLLKAVAERLKVGVRETDLIARFGGDEFTIILRSPEKIHADQVARRIVESFARPFYFGGTTIDFVGCSIGIAVYPKDGDATAALMKNADLAMYEAKKGTASWCHFEVEMARAG